MKTILTLLSFSYRLSYLGNLDFADTANVDGYSIGVGFKVGVF